MSSQGRPLSRHGTWPTGCARHSVTPDLRLTQELLGHADPASTAIYADWDRPAAVAAAAALPVPRRVRAVKEAG